jgi:hypothetical protein
MYGRGSLLTLGRNIKMWRITILLYLAILTVLSLGAMVSQMRLRNNYLRYPDESRPLELLPQIIDIALRAYWIIYTAPAVWLISSIFLILKLNQNPEKRSDWIQIHTSATILIGCSILLFFVTAGILPFLKEYIYLSK